MSKIIPPKVRLAAAGTNGAEVFNFYQIFGQLTSLYMKVADKIENAEFKEIWDEINDDLFKQVGEVYKMWDRAQRQTPDARAVTSEDKLFARIARLANRILLLEELTNIWTSDSKLARILCLLERKFQRIAQEISRRLPLIENDLRKFIVDSQGRLRKVQKLEESARALEDSIRSNYAIPTDI